MVVTKRSVTVTIKFVRTIAALACIIVASAKSDRHAFIPPSSSSTSPASDVVRSKFIAQSEIRRNRNVRTSANIGATATSDGDAITHTVHGVTCRQVPLDLPIVGTITVLEATAEAQEDLVDVALLLEDEVDAAQSDGISSLALDAGDPYGAVLWPAAWAVSNYLLTEFQSPYKDTSSHDDKGSIEDSDSSRDGDNDDDNSQQPLQGLTICELGTGTGLVSMASIKGGAKQVIATDYEQLALSLTQYAAMELNGCDMQRMEFAKLDMCDHDGTPLPQDVDIVVAADIMYEIPTGTAMAVRAVEALKNGCRVIVGDSPGRAGRPAFLETLKQLGVKNAIFRNAMGRTCSGPRHGLICGANSKSVSETPKELPVAIMELDPSCLVD